MSTPDTSAQDGDRANFASEYVPTFLEKIGYKLFPHGMPEDADPEGKMRDLVIIRTYWAPSIFDRLRLLFSGRLTVETRIATQNFVGDHKATALLSVRPPSILS